MCYSEISEIEANILFPAFFFFLRAKWKSQNGHYNCHVLHTTTYLPNPEF